MLRLEYELRELGWTQTDLAKRAGMARVSVNMVLRGSSPVWPSWQERIAAAIGWQGDPAELFAPLEVAR